MDERSRVALATALGALAGGMFGYLYLTEDGRRVREQIDPWLDNVAREMRHLRATAERTRVAADEAWRSLNDLRRASRQGPRAASGYLRSAG